MSWHEIHDPLEVPQQSLLLLHSWRPNLCLMVKMMTYEQGPDNVDIAWIPYLANSLIFETAPPPHGFILGGGSEIIHLCNWLLRTCQAWNGVIRETTTATQLIPPPPPCTTILIWSVVFQVINTSSCEYERAPCIASYLGCSSWCSSIGLDHWRQVIGVGIRPSQCGCDATCVLPPMIMATFHHCLMATGSAWGVCPMQDGHHAPPSANGRQAPLSGQTQKQGPLIETGSTWVLQKIVKVTGQTVLVGWPLCPA